LRTLGIIGGVSWHSTAEYYKLINQRIAQILGQQQSARLVITSLNLADILSWQKEASTDRLVEAFLSEGQRLKAAGCNGFLIASHTLSWLGDLIESEIGLKHLCLYDALFRKLNSIKAQKIGLIGTRYTMKDARYREKYEDAGFTVLTPAEPHLTRVATIVYKELVRGIFRADSQSAFAECFEDLIAQNVDAIVLGCTEIGLLVTDRTWPAATSPDIRSVPLTDLIETHVTQSTEWILRST
jgi:aspartate racemase